MVKTKPIIRGQTLSVKLSYTNNGEPIDLGQCVVSYDILHYPALEPYLEGVKVEGNVLLVGSEVTKQLEGSYVVRVYIDDNGFIDIKDMALSVTK